MITRNTLQKVAINIAKTVSKNAATEGDTTNYLAYQLPIIRRLFKNRTNTLKMPRQTGKTWTASFVAVAYLVCGIDVLVAYPTLQQGWKLLLSKIVDICKVLGIGLIKSNQYGIECANGACVHVVTTNNVAKSNRGFTVGLLIIDEAQDVDVDAIGTLSSSVNKYKRMNLDTILVMGTGGYRAKLLETSWRERGFALTHLLPKHIIEVDPKYAQVDVEQLETLGQQAYKIEVLCEMFEGGNSIIIKNMDEPLPEHFNENTYCVDVVGIDVGQNPDNTVAMWCKYYPGTIDRIEIYQTLQLGDSYDVQAEKLDKWIRENYLQQAHKAVEVNGIGRYLYDYLSKVDVKDTAPIRNVSPYTATNKTKRSLVYRIGGFDYDKAIHITDKASYNALNGLCSYVEDSGKWTCDHSDFLSAFMAAITRIGY